MEKFSVLEKAITRFDMIGCRGRVAAARAFTLVELLVVIAIISVLAMLLLPVLDSALYQSRLSACANNHKQFFMSCQMYGSDNADIYPYPGRGNEGLWTAPPLLSQYYGGDRAHEYYGNGLLWRLGYLPDRGVFIDPDWSNPGTPSGTFTTYCVSKNGSYYWNLLQLPGGNVPVQRASTWSAGCYVQYYHEILASAGKVPRVIGRKHPYTRTTLMCTVLGYSYPENGAHRKQFINSTYDDGHVRTISAAKVLAALGSRTDYGYSTTGNENHFTWWPASDMQDK